MSVFIDYDGSGLFDVPSRNRTRIRFEKCMGLLIKWNAMQPQENRICITQNIFLDLLRANVGTIQALCREHKAHIDAHNIAMGVDLRANRKRFSSRSIKLVDWLRPMLIEMEKQQHQEAA